MKWLQRCLELYEEWLNKKLVEDPSFLNDLKGKDLVCWCPLNQPCHADIILKALDSKRRVGE